MFPAKLPRWLRTSLIRYLSSSPHRLKVEAISQLSRSVKVEAISHLSCSVSLNFSAMSVSINPCSIMMAASKTTNKKATPVQEAPLVRKAKRGRPPLVKLPSEPLVPFATMGSKSTKDVPTSRRNYDSGISKEVMNNALKAAIQCRGHHMARTAMIYGVSRKSLDIRYESYRSNNHESGRPEKC